MILHLCEFDKFIEPFYTFGKENFVDFYGQHYFYINGESAVYKTPTGKNVFLSIEHARIFRYLYLFKLMNFSEKIILHGLFNYRILQLLTIQPWLLKKCYWAIWGGDLYTCQSPRRNGEWWKAEILRRFVIKRIKHFITHIKGDSDRAIKWYKASAKWHECFMYPSNLWHECFYMPKFKDTISILLGNSADPSNRHIEIIDKLRPYADQNICIYCPLSYGDDLYADKIEKYGKSIFRQKFVALRKYIAFDNYVDFLSTIDIAFFNHRRQQGMGNMITLLGMGKKVYLHPAVSSWDLFKDLSLDVFDVKIINLEKITLSSAQKNISIISSYFSKINLLNQWNNIFNEQ